MNTIAVLAALLVGFQEVEQRYSGPQKGEAFPGFTVYDASGPHKGKEVDYVGEFKGAPTLVLFGPTCEIKNGPRNRGVTLNTDIDCSPCQYNLALLDSCDNPRCMNELTADLVLDRATKMLAR